MKEMFKTFETELAGRKLVIETGKLAGLANGSVVVKYGDTVVMVNVTASKEPREGIDFFPLSVDYEEKLYAVGKIPGGFLLHPVEPQLPGAAAGKQQPAQTLLPVLGIHLSGDFREFLPKEHHFSGFLGAKAPAAAQKGDGLQQVGLSLGVVPDDQVDPRVKVQRQLSIVAEGTQLQLTQLHGW